MKKTILILSALLLMASGAAAQIVRPTGLPANYPEDGSTPAWYHGTPEEPLVSYYAKSWADQEGVAYGEVWYDAGTKNGYAYSNRVDGADSGLGGVYTIDGYQYIVREKQKSIWKIPGSMLKGNAESINALTGLNVHKSYKTEVASSTLCNYKDRFVDHRVIKQTSVYTDGKEEVGVSEVWIDCETGIHLRYTESTYGSLPSEVYEISIGPQPASRFKLPEGYKIVDLSAAGGMMGAQTGKSPRENTEAVEKGTDSMLSALEQMKKAMDEAKKK